MSLRNFGVDKNGRELGFGVKATCDHPGCNSEIKRGQYYACGANHGSTKYNCDKYFCTAHKANRFVNEEGNEDHDEVIRILEANHGANSLCKSCHDKLMTLYPRKHKIIEYGTCPTCNGNGEVEI